MKLSLSTKIVIVLSVVLLCTGVAVYSFMRLNSVEEQQDFDLYTLVPRGAEAVFETDRLTEMLEEVEGMQCSKDGHYLRLSGLFTCLRTFLNTWVEESPHALSKQMNKVLISFHNPGGPMDKVLYCMLGVEDYERVEQFIEQYSSPSYPVKTFDYRGEKIRIYTMRDGHFLAVYLTKKFMALSFQKKLLEQVIDARRDKTSLKHDASFRAFGGEGKQRNVASKLYVRMSDVPMGEPRDTLGVHADLSEWMAFNLKFAEEAIFCSGISHEGEGRDTVRSFVRAVCAQQNVSGYAGNYLPASTFMYEHRSMSDKQKFFAYPTDWISPKATSALPPYMLARDKELVDWLTQNAGDEAVSCFFLPDDVPEVSPCVVVNIPLRDEEVARRRFLAWLQSTPREQGAPRRPEFNPGYARYPRSQAFRKYLLPRNSLFFQLTGMGGGSFYTYACFYRGSLLLSEDALGLSAYIDAMERKEVLQELPLYKIVANTLAPTYGSLLMVDMETLRQMPASYKRLIPAFFFSHIDFFAHFIFACQFTCVEGIAYPNATLYYKN